MMMGLVKSVGVYLLYFTFTYLWGTLLSQRRYSPGYKLGVCQVPSILKFWIRPRFLFKEDIERSHARFLGIAYHLVFSLPAGIAFPAYIAGLFINSNFAEQLRDSFYFLTLVAGMLFMFIALPFELANLVIDHFRKE
jgi:hypothetical protein